MISKIKKFGATPMALTMALTLMAFSQALHGCAGSGDLSQESGFQANPFLWRATLEVISFAPLASTDPIGGVITTSWHTYPQQNNERFQITVYVLDRALRADALKVSIFRQTRSGSSWRAAASNRDLARRIEDLILTRARALRLSYETSR